MPIHPEHLLRIPECIRKKMVFEEGYGKPFGILDSVIAEQTGGIASRHELMTSSEIVILAKPVPEDLQELRENGTLWGYPHCVQQHHMTQIAIDRKQTLIAFEDMFVWGPNGEMGRHTFYKNNEMAGYCAVLHALQLKGIDGHYGNQRKVIIFSFGAVSRGAIYALKAHGFRDITICIQRPSYQVREEVLDCEYVTIFPGIKNEARMLVAHHDGTTRPLCDLISESDIIINGTLQEPDNPIDYVTKEEASCLKNGSLIIDVSCDEGMGFYFARPTSFKKPIIQIGVSDYYAVDHTPNYLWESATRSISAALIVHLEAVMAGSKNWEKDDTIKHAINIEAGIIKKPNILLFQNRQTTYPYVYNDSVKSS
jgi:alanine dehydrogenase